jgi:hypothetical protein
MSNNVKTVEKAIGLDEKEDMKGVKEESSPLSAGWRSVKTAGLKIKHPEQAQNGRRIGVDREKEVIYGYVVAQEGPFKSEGRGEFDREALETIVRLMAAAPNGIKSRFTHPDMSGDGIGSFLGRAKLPWIDRLAARDSEGELRTDPVFCVRADLHLDPSAHKAPKGNGVDLADYLMTICESDPDAVSTSLVLQTEEEYRIDAKGVPLVDDEGNDLPPLWRPTKIHASDWVCTGDAVDGALSQALSADGLPDGVVREAARLMDRQFMGKTRAFVWARCTAWLERYLERRFGSAAGDEGGPTQEPVLPDVTPDGLPTDEPKTEAAHDGCRSRHGLHYVKQRSITSPQEHCLT